MSAILGIAGTAGVVIGSALAASLTNKIADELANTTIQGTIQGFKRIWDSHAPTSYARMASVTKIEPFVMVDESFVNLPYSKEVMQAVQRVFTSNYLLAQASQNIIGGVSISKRIDRFTPDRSLDVASRHFLNMESDSPVGVGPYAPEAYLYSLPIPGVPSGLDRFGDLKQYIPSPTGLPHLEGLSVESAIDDVVTASTINPAERVNTGICDPSKTLREIGSLAIGQIVNIDITDGKERATMPIQIRLRPIGVSSAVVAGTFALRGKDYTIGSRIRALRVGEIDWKDLLFQTDAVREYRTLARQDKGGFYRKTYARANKNFLASLLTGRGSVGEMSSIIITTTDTVKDFTRQTGNRLSDFKVRQSIMEDTLTMIIAVVDVDHETLTIYVDGIDDDASYLISDLAIGGKNDGNDLAKLMNSLMEGHIPGRL